MITRRDFLKICTQTGIALSLSQSLLPHLVGATEAGELKPIPTIWLELGSCTGNTVSFDNTLDPSIKYVLTKMIDLRYHWILSVPQGGLVVENLFDTVRKNQGNFLLVVEGAPQTKEGGRFCYNFWKDGKKVIGLHALKEIGPQAKWVIAIGSCAAFGGPAAAHPNPTGATGVQNVLNRPVINVSGCPAHPDWFVGTLAHLLLYGTPELDAFNRPKMFYGKTIHDQCQRRQDFENGHFAKYPGEEGCLFKVGCKGPVTHAYCPNRQWNNHVNWPVKAATPCIGCTAPEFPDGMMPIMAHLPDINALGVKVTANSVGLAVGTLAALGIGSHLVGTVLSKRFHKHWVEGTATTEKIKEEKDLQEKILDRVEYLVAKEDDEGLQRSRTSEFIITSPVAPVKGPAKKTGKRIRKGFWGKLRGMFGRR